MKKLIFFLFAVIQINCFAQNNLVIELWSSNNKVIEIFNKGEMLLYDGNSAGIYNAEIKFIPASLDEERTLINSFYNGSQCTIRLKLTGNTSTSSGIVSLRKEGSYYFITVRGVKWADLKIYNSQYNVWEV